MTNPLIEASKPFRSPLKAHSPSWIIEAARHAPHYNKWTGIRCQCPWGAKGRTRLARTAGMQLNKLRKAPDKKLKTPEGQQFMRAVEHKVPEDYDALIPYLANRFKKGDILTRPPQTYDRDTDSYISDYESPHNLIIGSGEGQERSVSPITLGRWHQWFQARQHPLRRGIDIMHPDFTPREMDRKIEAFHEALAKEEELRQSAHMGKTEMTFPAQPGGVDWDAVREDYSPHEADRHQDIAEDEPHELLGESPGFIRDHNHIIQNYTIDPRKAGWHIKNLTPQDWQNDDGSRANFSQALEHEGGLMGHCIGNFESPNYRELAEEGRIKVHSLRDPKGQPHVTWHYNSDGSLAEMFGPNDDPVKPEYQKMINEWGKRYKAQTEEPYGNQEDTEDAHIELPQPRDIDDYIYYNHPDSHFDAAHEHAMHGVGENTEIHVPQPDWDDLAKEHYEQYGRRLPSDFPPRQPQQYSGLYSFNEALEHSGDSPEFEKALNDHADEAEWEQEQQRRDEALENNQRPPEDPVPGLFPSGVPVHPQQQRMEGFSSVQELTSFLRGADSWDAREFSDQASEVPTVRPPNLRDCTCDEGHKLDCPIHGLEAPNARTMEWSIPEGSPVGYPTAQPRTWQQAYSATHSFRWTPNNKGKWFRDESGIITAWNVDPQYEHPHHTEKREKIDPGRAHSYHYGIIEPNGTIKSQAPLSIMEEVQRQHPALLLPYDAEEPMRWDFSAHDAEDPNQPSGQNPRHLLTREDSSLRYSPKTASEAWKVGSIFDEDEQEGLIHGSVKLPTLFEERSGDSDDQQREAKDSKALNDVAREQANEAEDRIDDDGAKAQEASEIVVVAQHLDSLLGAQNDIHGGTRDWTIGIDVQPFSVSEPDDKFVGMRRQFDSLDSQVFGLGDDLVVGHDHLAHRSERGGWDFLDLNGAAEGMVASAINVDDNIDASFSDALSANQQVDQVGWILDGIPMGVGLDVDGHSSRVQTSHNDGAVDLGWVSHDDPFIDLDRHRIAQVRIIEDQPRPDIEGWGAGPWENRRPFVYHSPANLVVVGAPNSSHIQLEDKLQELLGPEPENEDGTYGWLWHPESGFGTINPPTSPRPGTNFFSQQEGHEPIVQALVDRYGYGHVPQAKWDFSAQLIETEPKRIESGDHAIESGDERRFALDWINSILDEQVFPILDKGNEGVKTHEDEIKIGRKFFERHSPISAKKATDFESPEPTHDPDDPQWDSLYNSDWANTHDYDPRWDYSDELRPEWHSHPLMQAATQRLKQHVGENGRVFAADLRPWNAVGMHIHGTGAEPVMLFDPYGHEVPELTPEEQQHQALRTVDHEYRHAQQEQDANGEPNYNEDDAESWTARRAIYPDRSDRCAEKANRPVIVANGQVKGVDRLSNHTSYALSQARYHKSDPWTLLEQPPAEQAQHAQPNDNDVQTVLSSESDHQNPCKDTTSSLGKVSLIQPTPDHSEWEYNDQDTKANNTQFFSGIGSGFTHPANHIGKANQSSHEYGVGDSTHDNVGYHSLRSQSSDAHMPSDLKGTPYGFGLKIVHRNPRISDQQDDILNRGPNEALSRVLSSGSVRVTEPDEWGNNPFIYHEPTNTVYMGDNGGDHNEPYDPADADPYLFGHRGRYWHNFQGPNSIEWYGEGDPPNKDAVHDALGAEREEPYEERWNFAKVATIPTGFDTMFHVSPRANRESILQEGLRGHEGRREESPWKYDWDQPAGNYLFDNPKDAHEYVYSLHGKDHELPEEENWDDENRYQYPETPHDFHDWHYDKQDDWYEENEPVPATEDPNGYDIYRVNTGGVPMAHDPETQLLQRGNESDWNLGDIYDAYQQHGHGEDPHYEVGDYHGFEPRRYYSPVGIHPSRIQLHEHVPSWGLTQGTAEEQYDNEGENSYPQPWAKLPLTERPLPGHESMMKKADKLHDFLMNPKSRPDLQTEEGQKWLQLLENRYHTPKTDSLMPWLTREWKKGRLEEGHEGDLFHHGEVTPNGEQLWRPLHPATVNHMADFMADKRHPVRKEVSDIMQHDVGSLRDYVDRYDQDMAARAEQEEHEEATRDGEIVHQWPDGSTIRRLTTPEELEREGDAMGHCVGSYADEVANGRTSIYSLRDPKGLPHATTEIVPTKFAEQPFDLEKAFEMHPTLRHADERTKNLIREYADAPNGIDHELGKTHPDNWENMGIAYGDNVEQLFNQLHSRYQNAVRTPLPENGEVVQIQGKANREPNDEYKQRLRQWFGHIAEHERPHWSDDAWDWEVDQLDAPDEIEDHHMQPSTTLDEYGLRAPRAVANYERLVEPEDERGGYYGTPDHHENARKVYELAKSRNEIPQLAHEVEYQGNKAMESLDQLRDMNYDYINDWTGPHPEDTEEWETMTEQERRDAEDRHEENRREVEAELGSDHGPMQYSNAFYERLNPHYNPETEKYENEIYQKPIPPETFSSWHI